MTSASTPKQTLTARQAQILELIRRHINDTGYPPTRADIASELGFKSPNAAEEHLKALARKGAIEMIPGASRGIRIPDMIDDGLPIVGRVAAGNPILAEENIEDRIDLPAGCFSLGVNPQVRQGLGRKRALMLWVFAAKHDALACAEALIEFVCTQVELLRR